MFFFKFFIIIISHIHCHAAICISFCRDKHTSSGLKGPTKSQKNQKCSFFKLLILGLGTTKKEREKMKGKKWTSGQNKTISESFIVTLMCCCNSCVLPLARREKYSLLSQKTLYGVFLSPEDEELKKLVLKVSTSRSMNKSFHAGAAVSVLLDVKWGPCCITEMLFLISSLFKLW